MKQHSEVLSIATRRGLNEITTSVREVVRAAAVREGLRREVVVQVLGE